MQNKILVRDFIANEWAQYADYDNRRSLPHIMDGLKITQRKALYTATLMSKTEKPVRVSQFASEAAKETAYHHGEVSMVDTVVKLAQDYPGSNNMPWMEKHGQFGSRLSNDSAAPRYIHTRLHQNWHNIFKKEDQAVVEYQYDDGDRIEPKYFIPVIPTILLNGADGVGNGFKSKILNYSISDIAKACREIVKHGKVKTPLIPHIHGWSGKIEKVERQVILTGVVEIVHSTKLCITELPPKYDNEKYKKLLNGLIEDGLVRDYENKSTEDGWHWIVHVPRTTTALGEAKITELLGLIEKTTENFVCWGMDGKAPLTFDSPEALVEHWYKERIGLYQKSIEHQIEECRNDITMADLKMRFIRWCLKNDFRKLSRKGFIESTVASIKNLTPEIAGDFVALPMYRITTDEVEKLAVEIDELLGKLDELESLTPVALMEKNLKGL